MVKERLRLMAPIVVGEIARRGEEEDQRSTHEPAAPLPEPAAGTAQIPSQPAEESDHARHSRGRRAPGLEFQQEMEQPAALPIDLAEISLRLDEPDLVADPMRHQRCLGIVENDAFLLVEPACALVNLGNDRAEP